MPIAVHTEGSRFPERRLRRQTGAAERKQVSDAQTPQQRLATLDERLGKDQGATKERLRLHARIAQVEAEKQAEAEKAQKKAAKKEAKAK